MTIITSTFHKETKNIKTGIEIKNVNGVNRINFIVPGSLFARNTPQLAQGMRFVSVNNVQCEGKTASQVAQLVKDAQGTVTVVVVDDDTTSAVPQATIVTATVVSNSAPPATAPTAPTATDIRSTGTHNRGNGAVDCCLWCLYCLRSLAGG
jgi:hypothetical protein